ncbi:hypothetical protein HK096_002960, partial [Nowakowskiella sp. JEL0078]
MLSALKGRITRAIGNKNEDYYYDPTEEPFREHVLAKLLNSLDTLLKKGWISDKSIEQIELHKQGWDLDLRNNRDHQNSKDSRYDQHTLAIRANTLKPLASQSISHRSLTSKDSEMIVMNKALISSKLASSVAIHTNKSASDKSVVAIADYSSTQDGDLIFAIGDIISKIES